MTRAAIKVVTIAATLTIMAAAATGATITFSDLLDANPIVTTSSDLIGVMTVITFEKAVVTGLLPAGLTVPVGTRSVILTEPAVDPFGSRQSDFVTLTIGAAAPTFSVTFESDGALNYDMDVAALPPGTPTVLEDGTFQNVSTALNSGAFGISVQSDLNNPEVPEPASGLLLLSGLLLTCIGYIGRKKAVTFKSLRCFG
jgi:hypothetical protein